IYASISVPSGEVWTIVVIGNQNAADWGMSPVTLSLPGNSTVVNVGWAPDGGVGGGSVPFLPSASISTVVTYGAGSHAIPFTGAYGVTKSIVAFGVRK